MSFFKLTIRDVPLDNQTVLVRTDYNVPIAPDGTISDDSRIRASLPTLNYLLNRGCKVVIISHLGRPKSRDSAYSLEPVALRLAQLIHRDIRFVDHTFGDKVYQAVKRAPGSSITVLENLRFYPEEEADDTEFARRIVASTGARYFVQDGFGVVHRAHASTDAITQFVPSVAGLLLEEEYNVITSAMEAPKRPLMAILGGAKVSDKIKVINRFIKIADKIIIGGAMANNFLAYKGISVGASRVEAGQREVLDSIYKAARQKVGKNVDDFIILPTDVAVATSMNPGEKRKSVEVDKILPNEIALDIGDKSISRMVQEIQSVGTVIWNGPLGYVELPEFAHGTAELAQALASQPDTISIIGGGDTASFILKWDKRAGKSFTHVLTGGGASLELMAGNILPGVESLLDGRRQIEYTNSNKHK